MYIGHRAGRIEVVTDTLAFRSDLQFIQLSNDLSSLPKEALLNNYEVRDGRIVLKRNRNVQRKDLKIAIVGSYGTNCGMSTYCRYLTDAMRPLVGEVKVFAEMDSTSTEAFVVKSWDRHTGNYDQIVPDVKAYNPDIVYIQHEYGSFSNPVGWNILVGRLSAAFRTIVVLHSIYNHKDKLVFEAPCQEIIVHSASGRDLLRQKGIDHAPIHHIPHGCTTPVDLDTKYGSMVNANVIFQFGFGFEYKGWSTVPDIIDGLRGVLPGVYYIAVFNMSRFSLPFHENYFTKLMSDFERRNVANRVVLHKGFRSEEILFSYMKQAKVNLFPYWNHPDWRVHGASGAVRLALASGTPTVVGDVPFFDEFKGYLPVCSTTQQYIETIERIISDADYAAAIKARMERFIEERTWEKVADWYLSVTPEQDWTAPVGS